MKEAGLVTPQIALKPTRLCTALGATLSALPARPTSQYPEAVNAAQLLDHGKSGLPNTRQTLTTWKPRQRRRENRDYFQMIGRMLRRGLRRVEIEDTDDLAYLLELRAASDDLITLAIHHMHYVSGITWAAIAAVTGTTPQAVTMRYKCPNGPDMHPHQPGCNGPALADSLIRYCGTPTRDGKPCRQVVMTGTNYCVSHPATAIQNGAGE